MALEDTHDWQARYEKVKQSERRAYALIESLTTQRDALKEALSRILHVIETDGKFTIELEQAETTLALCEKDL
jgi:hypothetical protein